MRGERVNGERMSGLEGFIHFLPLRQGEYPKGEGVDWDKVSG